MTLQICSYQGCYVQRYPCSSITFFQLPNDEPRRSQWILNSGNKQLLKLKTHQKRYFCETHFRKKDIKPHFYRKLLYKNAVPIPYMSDNVPTTTTSISDKNYTEFDEIEEMNEAVQLPDCHETNEKSGEDCEDDTKQYLTLSPSDYCFKYSNDDDEYVEENNIANDSLDVQKITSDPSSKDITEIATTAQTETISIDVICLTTPPVTETISSSITSPASLTTADAVCKSLSSVTTTTSDTLGDADTSAAPELHNHNAINSELSDSVQSEKSYESDKHFALSLVYHFQRLNAKKKAQAKIDILTYLVALEQDNDA
ncbi:uncharacterized protein LOC129247074 [Anastrepha obliqua]|uniref:uncharacterized protein LOC129247074 n=1 Tax=Anastrepha obliqua TaxID=95512 RepID=UPI00240A1E5F|nr:uncharacterized protein LOC129247074 [Anastrepha obliqua]